MRGALAFERKRLAGALEGLIDAEDAKSMDHLLADDEGMHREAVHLYLLCFIHDRYQRLNDNLLGAFCSLVRCYVDEIDAAPKEAIYRFKVQASEDIEQGAKVLALFLDPSIDEQTPFAAVRDQAHALLAPERRQQLCRQFAGDGSLDKATFEWKEVDGIMAKVKRNRLLKRENGGGSGGLKFKMVVIRLRTRRLIVWPDMIVCIRLKEGAGA